MGISFHGNLLPSFVKPIQDKIDAGKLVVFRIKVSHLVQHGLAPLPDDVNHVSVQPAATVTEESYQNSIKSTRELWQIVK